MVNGAVYMLIRIIGYIMKDQRVEEEFLWYEHSSVKDDVAE
jgi:hypothetical protein